MFDYQLYSGERVEKRTLAHKGRVRFSAREPSPPSFQTFLPPPATDERYAHKEALTRKSRPLGP